MDETHKAAGFEWDKGNADKNEAKHNVARAECEEVFFNAPLFIAEDMKHSAGEKRQFALGRTFGNRPLALVFTMRGDKIRVISARDMSRKEREVYEKAQKDSGL